jgi:FAD/FMN-containing dehydrogenase
MTDQSILESSRLDDFPVNFQGTLLRSGDDGYQASRRIFNMRHDEATPALIAKPIDQAAVAMALRYASENDLPVAIRGGGHGIDGAAMPQDSLVLDMSGFKAIDIDPENRTIRAGAGVLLGEIDAAAQAHGLVVPSGTVSSTGIAGLTRGGGLA